MINIAIFASGSGTNAQAIAEYFADKKNIRVRLILANKTDAYVLQRAEKLSIPAYIFNRTDFYDTDNIVDLLKRERIDFIVLAGFLWLVPRSLLTAYSHKIINIHPALLPKYGGKGMYGMKVHEAVIQNHEKESGITIHYVTEEYDAGDIIFQAKCKVDTSDTPDTLAIKIHQLEYTHYPKVIESVITKLYPDASNGTL